MRIDKFIWAVRLKKTRSLAGETVSKGKALLNGQKVKSSKEVQVGDVVGITMHNALFEYEILVLPKSRIGAKLVADHLRDITQDQEKEKYELYRLNQSNYRQNGTGKPSTKDRRDLKKFLD